MSFYENSKRILSVAATTDAEVIAQNKVIATGIEIPKAVRHNGGCSLIKSITILDEDNTSVECDVIFSSISTVIAQDEGKAVGEDVDDLDTALQSALGWVQFVAANHTDLVDARLHTKTGIDLAIQADSGTRSIYMHIVNRGSSVTFGKTGAIKVRIGVEY